MNIKCLQLYRVVIFINHAVATVFTFNIDFSKVNDQQAWDMKLFAKRYFTGWNMLFQMLFLVVAFANTVIQRDSIRLVSPAFKKRINELQGFIFTAFVTPASIFVFLMFWTLWNIDRELILSQKLDPLIPSWLNHCMHTVIIIPVVVELLFCKMHLPKHRDSLIAITALHVVYTAVLFGTYLEYGRWIYNIFYVLGWHQRILFNCGNLLIGLIMYYAAYKLQQVRWGPRIVKQVKHHKAALKSAVNFN